MAKTWFPHEEGLAEGEESKPLFGPKYGFFWWVGMIILWGFALMGVWVSCSFLFAHKVSNP